MDKKEAFKNFARLHPELVEHIKSGNMTWQRFYEIYDIYGDDATAWSAYLKTNNLKTDPVGSIAEKMKGIDMNSIQEHIKTAQKALSLVSELASGKETTAPLTASVPKVPRPINQFFED